MRFVKGIWGVTTLYSGPGVVPGYWLSSQKGHSVKEPPAETATCRPPLQQQHPRLGTAGRHQPSRRPNPPSEQPTRPPPAASLTASYIATLARSGTRPPGGTRPDLPPQRQGLLGLLESRRLAAVARCGTGVWWRSRAISRSTVARLLPMVLALLAEVGGIVYDREVGGPYRVRVVDVDVLAGRGVGGLLWAAADSSYRLYPKGWSQTDRATYAVWWGWSGWCGDVAAPVDVEGLAARAGLRPSTLRRRAHPAGLWNHRGDRLAVGRWEDPSLDAHRERVRYDDYRCSVPGRSGLEGATVRWHGHTNQPEPDTAPPSVNEASDDGLLWGGLIAYKPSYTTSAREGSSGARPSGDAPRKQSSPKQRIMGRSPPVRRRQRWTPERRNYETRAASGFWTGPDMGWVGSDLARRWGWHVAEQAALEVDRVVRLGRPVQNPRGLARHFARCFARPQLCHQRHQGACGNTRLNQHRGRRLDEQLESRTQHSDHSSPTGPISAPNPATEPGRPVPVTAPEPRVNRPQTA